MPLIVLLDDSGRVLITPDGDALVYGSEEGGNGGGEGGVRIFGYLGIAQLKTDISRQFAADSVYVLVEPYEWTQSLVPGVAAVTSAPVSSDKCTLLRVEVPDGQMVRYEVNPPGRSVVPGNGSPSMSGKTNFFWGPGWTISIIEEDSDLPLSGDAMLDFSDPANSQYQPLI